MLDVGNHIWKVSTFAGLNNVWDVLKKWFGIEILGFGIGKHGESGILAVSIS